MLVALENEVDVRHRLGAAREAVFHDRVVVDRALRLPDQPIRNVGPAIGIVAMFLGEAARVLDVAEADVVRAENELDALALGLDLRPVPVELPEITARAFDALPRIVRIDAQLARRRGHELHQAGRAGPRTGPGIEVRLLVRLRRDETPVPAGDARKFAEPVVVRRKT